MQTISQVTVDFGSVSCRHAWKRKSEQIVDNSDKFPHFVWARIITDRKSVVRSTEGIYNSPRSAMHNRVTSSTGGMAREQDR